MMPMGMNLMVPPPMLAAMGQGNPFQGMAGIPGMPPMMGIPGMVPAPQMPVPPGGGPPPPHPGMGGAPGLLGEMPQQPPAGVPPPQQLNDSILNSSNEESAMSASDMMMSVVGGEDGVVGGSKRGKYVNNSATTMNLCIRQYVLKMVSCLFVREILSLTANIKWKLFECNLNSFFMEHDINCI